MALSTVKSKTHRGSGKVSGARSLRLNRAEALLLWAALKEGKNGLYRYTKADQMVHLLSAIAKFRVAFNIKE